MSSIIPSDIDLGSINVVNESGIPDDELRRQIRREIEKENRISEDSSVSRALSNWASSFDSASRFATNGSASSRTGGILAQNKYVAPKNLFDQFRKAAEAARDDDIVSSAVETTEQLAFKRVLIESESKSQEENDVWDQIREHMELETRLREIWRELFIISQCYVAIRWVRKDFRLNGETPSGKKSKKVYKNVLVPELSILDPCKVLPVGDFMFNQERLVYLASSSESAAIEQSIANLNSSNNYVNNLFTEKYDPPQSFLNQVRELTGTSNHDFYLLPKDLVFRITSTRPQYQMFADVRMMSVLELLDLKHNLREMDRADIIGSLNAIILVKKGSDSLPANQDELAKTHVQMHGSARTPIIVSDHRLEIEFIQRKVSETLKPERYNNLDSRITSRLFQVLASGSYNSGTALDNSPSLFKVIAATMEARRDNIRDQIMRKVFYPIVDKNTHFSSKPVMNFHPRRIALEFDHRFAQYILELLDVEKISLETALAEVDLTLDEEAAKIYRQREMYGDIFPYSEDGETSSGLAKQRADGRNKGGTRNGGGANLDSFAPSPNNRSRGDEKKSDDN